MSTWRVIPGTTASFVYRWGAPPLIYVDVTVSKLTPLQLTATAHGVPDGWSVAIADMAQLFKLQADSWPPGSCDFRAARVPDADTIEFNQLDANRINAGALNTSGTVAYETPVALSGFTGTFTYTDAAGDLVVVTPAIDNTAKTITIVLDNTETLPFTVGTTMSFELQLTSGSGVVTQLDAGVLEVVDGTGC